MFHLRSLRVTVIVIASLADAAARAKATTTFARCADVLRGDPMCRDVGPDPAFERDDRSIRPL